jgi:hypothetical protein
MLTRSDKILIFGFVTFACFLFIRSFFASDKVSEALIKVGNGPVQKVSLKMDRRIDIEEEKGRLVIEIKDQRVKVVQSSCFQKICVDTGWINRTSQNIICLPSKVLVSIERKESSKIDGITY